MAITSIRPAKKIPALKKYIFYLLITLGIFGLLLFNQERIPEVLGIAKKAKISVISEEGAKVYADNKYLGDSPVDSIEIKSGLVNLSIKGNKNSYTTSLNLIDKSENIIFRDLGINKQLSSGINIWEGTLDDKKVELFLFPEYAKVMVNEKETTYDAITGLEAGEYKFKISADGFKETSFTVNVRKEFKTNIEVKLSPLPNSKDLINFGGYQNIYSIYSSNSDVFYNSKDWIDYFLYFYTKRELDIPNYGSTKEKFFDYFVDFDGRIFDRDGNQIDTLDSIDSPTNKKVGLLLRSVDKGKINERNFKSLLFFNSNVDLAIDSTSDSQKYSAKIASLTDDKVSVVGKETLTQPQSVLGLSNPSNAINKPTTTSPVNTVNAKKYVIINNDWLRVRKEPNGVEIGQAKLNEEYEYLDETTDGWVRIVFKNNVIGYVSKQFVKNK
jgi:hypothetical protein